MNIDLVVNLDSKLESLPNITKAYRNEKRTIIGPKGGKIGLVYQDLTVTKLIKEMAIKKLSEVLKISEEEVKSTIETDFVEELKRVNHGSVIYRFWAQKGFATTESKVL